MRPRNRPIRRMRCLSGRARRTGARERSRVRPPSSRRREANLRLRPGAGTASGSRGREAARRARRWCRRNGHSPRKRLPANRDERMPLAGREDVSRHREHHAKRIRPPRRRARERGRAPHLRRPGRGEPRRRRVAAHVLDRADRHPPRAGRGLHGGDARAADGRARRLPVDARARRAQPHDGRRLRPSRRHADADDHRAEADPQCQAGALPDRRHRPDHAAADEIVPADRHGGVDPDAGARGLPARCRGEPRPRAPRAARGHRRRGGRRRDRAGASDRSADRGAPRATPRRRDDPRRPAPAGDDRGRRQPAAPARGSLRLRAPHRPALLQHADGQGRGDRRLRPLHGDRRAVGARLRARRDRPRRPHRLDRPRHDREAAVPDGQRRGRHQGNPHRLRRGRRRAGVPPRRRGGRRHPRDRAGAGGPARRTRRPRSRGGGAAPHDPDAHQRARRGGHLPGDAAAARPRRAQR